MEKRKFLSLLITVAMLLGMLPVFSIQAAEDDTTYLKADFDDWALTASGKSYEAEVGKMYMVWKPGISEFSAPAAPSPEAKLAGTSLTAPGETDKALKYNLISGKTGQDIYMHVTVPTNVDLYAKGSLVVSTNVYIDNFTGEKVKLNAGLRGGDKAADLGNNLFRFTQSNFVAFGANASNGETNAKTIKNYAKNKWMNVKFVFDTKACTYDLYVDGEQVLPDAGMTFNLKNNVCFHGDPNEGTTKTVISTIRLQVLNADANTSGEVYFDDIYLGTSAEVTEPTETPSVSPDVSDAPTSPSEVFNQSSFEETAVSNIVGGKNGGYNGEKGSLWLQSQAGRDFNFTAAPSPETKLPKTALTSGSEDKALQINIVETDNTSGSHFVISGLDKLDFYGKSKVTLSMNMFVETYGSKGYLTADLRYGNGGNQINNLFRLDNGNNIYTFDKVGDQETHPIIVKRPDKKWFNVKFDFDPKKGTYDFYMDGEYAGQGKLYNTTICFPGDAAAEKNAFKELRFQFTSVDKTSFANVYIDDIFLGEEPVKDIKVNDLYFTDGDTKLETIPADARTIYGAADVVYSRYIGSESCRLLAALYDGEGRLQNVWTVEPEMEYTNLAVNVFQTAEVYIPLAAGTVSADSAFKLFVLDGYGALKPLTEAAAVNAQ